MQYRHRQLSILASSSQSQLLRAYTLQCELLQKVVTFQNAHESGQVQAYFAQPTQYAFGLAQQEMHLQCHDEEEWK